jgi:hypothetical protein
MYGSPSISGANFTSVANSSLDSSSVTKQGPIVSSITLSSMYGAPTLVGTNFTSLPGAQVGDGVPAANIAAWTLDADVIASSIAVNKVYTGSILNGAVTLAKLANMNSGRILGRQDVADGVPEEVPLKFS